MLWNILRISSDEDEGCSKDRRKNKKLLSREAIELVFSRNGSGSFFTSFFHYCQTIEVLS